MKRPGSTFGPGRSCGGEARQSSLCYNLLSVLSVLSNFGTSLRLSGLAAKRSTTKHQGDA